jgi:predicted kinase
LEAEMGRVIVMMGISGAGKDTWIEENFPSADIHSTDKFFVLNGEYKFDVTKLGEGHAWCLRTYTEAVQKMKEQKVIVVNNTNTSLGELAPYCALALAYGHELKIVALLCPPEVAVKRNVHGTPAKSVFQQDARLRKTLADLPPWWSLEVVFTD